MKKPDRACAVDDRLRLASQRSSTVRSWPAHVDMSSEAITDRLRTCAEISELAVSLESAGLDAGLGSARAVTT